MNITKVDKLVIERDELQLKYSDLMRFLNSEDYCDLDEVDQELLCAQKDTMYEYLSILNKRISRVEGNTVNGVVDIRNIPGICPKCKTTKNVVYSSASNQYTCLACNTKY